MSGYRDKPEVPPLAKHATPSKNLGFFLLAPAIVGLFLLIDGFADGGKSRMAVGLLLLAIAPLFARAAWRRYFGE